LKSEYSAALQTVEDVVAAVAVLGDELDLEVDFDDDVVEVYTPVFPVH